MRWVLAHGTHILHIYRATTNYCCSFKKWGRGSVLFCCVAALTTARAATMLRPPLMDTEDPALNASVVVLYGIDSCIPPHQTHMGNKNVYCKRYHTVIKMRCCCVLCAAMQQQQKNPAAVNYATVCGFVSAVAIVMGAVLPAKHTHTTTHSYTYASSIF